MINLKQEIDILAHDIDKPFDFALKRRLLATYISARARFLRDSLTNNRIIPQEYYQICAIPVKKVKAFELYYKDDFKISVVTTEIVPTPIRLQKDTPFESVTSQDGSISFANGDFATIKFNANGGRFVNNTGRYIYHGEHIACYHNEPSLLSSPMIVIRGLFPNPLLVNDYLNHYTYNEENFPMPADLAQLIRERILSNELRIAPENQTVIVDGE